MEQAPPRIFSSPAYRARRARATFASDVILAQDIAQQMALRISAINRRFRLALDLSSRPQAFELLQPFAASWLRTGTFGASPDAVADDEWVPFAEESFDLVTSVLSLHAVNDLPGVLAQIRRILKPDGLFIAALFGGETLKELRTSFAAAEEATLGGASPRVAPFADVRDLGSLLQRAGYALSVADVERTLVRYRDVSRLFADLRALGETNVLTDRRRECLSKRTLSTVIREYQARFAESDGRFPATFDSVFLTGWAPHESQQKALRPGSAQIPLADALSSIKRSTGSD